MAAGTVKLSLFILVLISGCVHNLVLGEFGGQRVEFVSRIPVDFYIDDVLVGSGSSVMVNKSDIMDGALMWIDIEPDGTYDISYKLSKEDRNRPKIFLENRSADCLNRYIRPDLVSGYLEKIKFSSPAAYERAHATSAWLKENLGFAFDERNYNKLDFWALPDEFLRMGSGDCEDWTVAFLSIMKNVTPETKCCGFVREGEVDGDYTLAMCDFGERFSVFSQRHGDYSASSVEEALAGYAEFMGISRVDVYFAFDDEECVLFHSSDEFFEWVENA
ncbi:transglutaminase domain-containing protein [Candidatus Bathyarchaeota archaeon]|nr:transglutaminase domain-containing protein [Candidatus Bathyarchaeota archaeon]